jgi:hypothetical protein
MLYPLWETESPVRRDSGREGKTISHADSVQIRESRHTASRIIHREKFYVRTEESAPGVYSQVHSLQTAWTLALRRLPTGFHQSVEATAHSSKSQHLRPFHNFCGQLVNCPVYAAFLEQHQSSSSRCSKFRRAFSHTVKGLPPV